MKEELAKEKAKNEVVKAELESTINKMKFIVVDAILNARAELMREFKRGKHANWDPDQEIHTWKDREAVLAKGDGEESDKEEDEFGSPKHVELRNSSK